MSFAGGEVRAAKGEHERRGIDRLMHHGEICYLKAMVEDKRPLAVTSAPPPTYLMVLALETLPDEELAQLARLLTKMVRSMGIERTPPTMFMSD